VAARPLADLKAGDTVDGTVIVRRKKGGVFVDIGSEVNALLDGAHPSLFARLDLQERLEGLTVERVEVDQRRIDVSFAGLADFVADRPPRGFKEVARIERNAGEKLRSMRLDGSDLQRHESKGVMLKLVGGFVLDCVDEDGTLTLLLEEEGNKSSGSIEDPFQGLVVKQNLLGTVRSRVANGETWAEIGAKKLARIMGPEDLVKLLRVGEKIDMVIKTIKRKQGLADVIVPGLKDRVAGRAAKQTQLKDVEVGSLVTGVVEGRFTRFKDGFRGGTLWVNFGATVAARVQCPGRRDWQKAELGTKLKFKIEKVDLDKSRVDGFLKY